LAERGWWFVFWDLVLIFTLQATYVTVTTVRWIILVRGMRYLASFISFFEILLYVVALGLVVNQLGDPIRVFVYALGYAVGSLAGSLVEERLAIGYSLYHIMTTDNTLAVKLRAAGLGVTCWTGQGRLGDRQVLLVVSRRRWGRQLLKLVADLDPLAFVVQTEPKNFRGGFMLKLLKPGPQL